MVCSRRGWSDEGAVSPQLPLPPTSGLVISRRPSHPAGNVGGHVVERFAYLPLISAMISRRLGPRRAPLEVEMDECRALSTGRFGNKPPASFFGSFLLTVARIAYALAEPLLCTGPIGSTPDGQQIDPIVSYRARREQDTLPPMTREQRDFLRKQIDAQMRERVQRARSANAQANTKAQASARAQARTHAAGSVTSPVVRKAPERPRLKPAVSLAAREEVNRSVRALRAGRGGDRTRFLAT